MRLHLTIENVPHEKCCGCAACVQLCPKQCITMQEDAEGFLYPHVNDDMCIKCGKCYTRCPQINLLPSSHNLGAYAVYHKTTDTLIQSSSGGVFSLLAEVILGKGGIVFGASMFRNKEGNFSVKHIGVKNSAQLSLLRGSKYVQSDIGESYIQAKSELQSGNCVLFTGTPCQIAGLYAYLGTRPENLYTSEIICHGVPNIKLFQKSISYHENRINGKINTFYFRRKIKGWGLYYYYYDYTKNNSNERFSNYGIADSDPYYISFLKAINFRESCYSCTYAKEGRVADITMGDFWDIEMQYKEFSNSKGVSCVLVNTEHGDTLFKEAAANAQVLKVKYKDIVSGNHNLIRPTIRPASRDIAYRNISEKPELLFNSPPYYLGVKKQLIATIKSMFPIKLKWIIKRIIRKKGN